MMEQSVGIAIHQSLRLVQQAGREINSLMDLIKREVDAVLAPSGDLGGMIKIAQEWSDDDRCDETGWIYTDHGFSLGLASKRKKNAERFLSFQISLAGDGMSSKEENKEPLLHINLWNDPIDFDNEIYLRLDWANEDENDMPILQEKVFFNWNAESDSWVDQGWSYTLKLVSLNTISDIRNKIVRPITELLKGKTLGETSLADIAGIVHYYKGSDDKFYLEERTQILT